MPPSSLLRALKHRSTPTLSSGHFEPVHPKEGYIFIPSIFVTLPIEEGGHFWCILPGSACPAPVPLSPTIAQLDVPLPDISAIEDTIDKLRRAGEAPTFRRPTRPGEVVLPKKKLSHRSQHHHPVDYTHHYNQQQHYSTEFHGLLGESQQQRSRTPPIPLSRQFSERETSQEISSSRIPKNLRKNKSRPPPLTSASYESVIATPFSPSSPEASQHARSSSPKFGEQKEKRRGSFGWLFSNKRAARKSMEVVAEDEGKKSEDNKTNSYYAVLRNVSEQRCIEPALLASPISPGAGSAGTYESDTDKPLPLIPNSVAMSISEATVSSSGLSKAALDSKQDMSPVESAKYPSKALPEKPTSTISMDVSSKSATVKEPAKSSPERQGSLKRKFSLKRLREKFLTSPAPPVPAIPPSVSKTPADLVGMSELPAEATDLPLTQRSLPSSASAETDETESESLPIDTPFTHPPIPESVTEPVVAPLSPKDEEFDPSTSSEDSNNISSGSSAASTPDSSPPDTPDHVEFGPIFEMQNKPLEIGAANAKLMDPITVASDGDIPRSNAIQTKLASFHFDQIDFDTNAF